ncbi:LOW QUALITY PROTEIN: dynein axonemal heavy chain 1 [Amazona ochrocephala]
MEKAKKNLMSSLGGSPRPPDTNSGASCLDCSAGTSLLVSHSCKQGPSKHLVFRQKMYSADVLMPAASNPPRDGCAGPQIHHALLKEADLEQHTPKVTTFRVPEDLGSVLDKQVMGPTTENLTKSDFPVQSYQPKVQIPYRVLPGQCPRSIEIERRRRLYLSFDIAQLLASKGIASNQLMPRHHDPDNMPTIQDKKDPLFPIYLSLKVFDNEEYDCRTPEEWISLGLEPGSHDRKPVPGKALLPTDDVLGHEDPKNPKLIYQWIDVGVLDYDKKTKLYLVHKTKNGMVRNEEGRPILNGGVTSEGRAPLLPCQYWVPRVCLLFLAEDPRVFAQRVVSADKLRKKTEALLRYNLYVDCMPTDGLNSISEESLQRVKFLAMNTPKLRKAEKRILDLMCCLEKEVRLDYERTMNKISFDRVVTSKPELFFYVTLPHKEEEKGPEKGLVCIPGYPFKKQEEDFNFVSLLKRPEVILDLTEVQDECNKVAIMSLFNTALAKYVCLEEFEQIQTQTFTEVQMFLKDTWIDTLATAITSNLRKAGTDWHKLEQTNWDVYLLSKLRKLMNRIRFMLQDSLRYLVQNSLISFTQVVLDACHGVLNCSKDMKWGDDIINSPYRPLRNPLFLTDLVLDTSGIHFSPPAESFEKSLLSLFDEGILATHTVPQLEKYVLENVAITGTPLLDSVGLHEPEVEKLRETLRSAIQMAVIPLHAYAKRYEKFLELNNNDIPYLLRDYEEQCPSAQKVRNIVNMYLSEKENVDNTLPVSIVIGPFHVSTEVVKQNLTAKYKALATSMLDILAENLHLQVESICNTYEAISCRMHERPNNIEELTELREWMQSVPAQLAVQEELIRKVMKDYQVMEEFSYNLTDEDFSDKWTASYWPLKISEQAESLRRQHQEDEDRFRKNHVMDQNSFQDKLEEMEVNEPLTINCPEKGDLKLLWSAPDNKLSRGRGPEALVVSQLTVGRFSIQADASQANGLANKAREVRKQLQELQSLAAVYNNRERIFGIKVTNYDRLSRLVKDFQPYHDLWTTVSDWMRQHEKWMNDPLVEIDSEPIEKIVNDSSKTMQRCVRHFKDSPACQGVAMEFRDKIDKFKPYVPLIQGLCSPGMREQHWDMMPESIKMDNKIDPSLTVSRCLEMNLLDHIKSISKVAEAAGKEYAIENELDKMESENSIFFPVDPYKDTGTFILKNTDETSQLLEDHIVLVQSTSFSPFKKPFEERMNAWENKLKVTQDVLLEWLNCQLSWLYLEPIFSSEDIKRQLPLESQHYQEVDKDWRDIMKSANENLEVISVCPDPVLLQKLQKHNQLLELLQKGLSEYPETKRRAFPRFCFLSDDELLEILSQTKDPTAAQPHLRKCFENIAQLLFQEDLQITHMYSAEGEEVKLLVPIYPTENVEDWLLEVENTMKASVQDNMERSIGVYPETPHATWVLQWPGQVVIAGSQMFWRKDVSEALEAGDLASRLFPQLKYFLFLTQLGNLIALVCGKLSKAEAVLSALIVLEIHAKDVAGKLVEENVTSMNAFEWISQLRYYWTKGDLYMRAVNAEFLYGYEYLGNTGHLVITPLTDRCYLTLTGALHPKFGGALAAPAGTGKTETAKDLGTALAIQTVVFNRSDQLDFMATGKTSKGLASSGTWGCFNEFICIDIEGLSVVAQQITTIQKALQQRVDRSMFEGAEIPLVPSCAVFITANPGYAGHTELPDNLKALFCPVAAVVPDYSMIAEILLCSFGFDEAKILAKKITTTFRLLSEQLSSQDRYDFRMRAVKTVISTAGNLKRENPTMDVELICLWAIRDANVPKFLKDDLTFFSGIVSDLLPKIKEEPVDYGILEEAIRKSCIKENLKDADGFVTECIQLYEMTVVQHGLMLVGPMGSGKTQSYQVLAAAVTSLKGQPAASGGNYEAVRYFVLTPKSITMGQPYGEFNLLTHEWTDGILSSLLQRGAAATDTIKKWYVFDGPVDALWIENMNTVLDDNKKLCLSSGEIIKLSESMTMMFVVQDLAVASPATVPCCGTAYLEPSVLGLEPFIERWLRNLPGIMKPFSQQLSSLFKRFLKEAIGFVLRFVTEVIASTESNLTGSLLVLLECFFQPLRPLLLLFSGSQGIGTVPQEKTAHVKELIEPWFIFALISVGAAGDPQGYTAFSLWLREKMAEEKIQLLFPDEGLVYDYKLNDAGLSSPEDDLGEEVVGEVYWEKWLEPTAELAMVPDTNFCDIIVPTMNTVMAHCRGLSLYKLTQVLCIGPTGTGRTLTITDKLLKSLPLKYVTHFLMFWARTSANQTQDLIDSKLDKRQKGVFGPPVGRYFIFFIDDLNMPMLDACGAQPPIELLRQWMDHRGWYDRKRIGAFKKLVDINFVCAKGPPGGGRNPVTPRLTRRFSYLSFTEMEDSSKKAIFSTILGSWMGKFCRQLPSSPPVARALAVKDLNEPLVDATIGVYLTITSQLLPTSAKSHYTFNLRDLSKVFQGMLMAEPSTIPDKLQLLELWCHESCRVVCDRLVSKEDRTWFGNLMKSMMEELDTTFEEVVPSQPVLFGGFMDPDAHIKLYKAIDSQEKHKAVIEDYLKECNEVNTPGVKLVLFMDAIQHICISRILRQAPGTALLLGVGGSGRQSLTRLATHMAHCECFQIELSRNSGMTEWRGDVKKIMMKAGIESLPKTFLFVDTQVTNESFLEDINNLLNSGDIPSIYSLDDGEQIMTAVKPIVWDLGQQPTNAKLMAAYRGRVHSNIHTVTCMSPIGEVFCAHLRQFPSLVNYCTINWFNKWPAEALQSVASSFLLEISHLGASMENVNGMIQVCVETHQSVAKKCQAYLAELARHNYVTPKSYIEFLIIFSSLIGKKKQELNTAQERMKGGLDKLLRAADVVAEMLEELESSCPLLAQAAKDTLATVDQLQVDAALAEGTRSAVQAEEMNKVRARTAQAIADDAQRDLAEALSALGTALASLRNLKKSDVSEVTMKVRPPPGLKMVIEAVCILEGVKARKVAGGKLGSKVDDSWEPGRGLLQGARKFLGSLFKYDKDNITDSVIKAIQPYTDNQEFQPAAIAKISKVYTSICQWVRAMHKYRFVAKVMEPKGVRGSMTPFCSVPTAGETLTTELSVIFNESTASTPLPFVLSPGTGPAADLYMFAEGMKFSQQLSAISHQGQAPRAEAMIRSAMEQGNWGFFQSCHLAPSRMPSLEGLVEGIDPSQVYQDFLLWLTSLPSNHFPVSLLQNSFKMTIEPPHGVKASLLKSYTSFSDDFLPQGKTQVATEFKSLLLSLCFFHGNMLERRKFGLGFNIPYEFTDGDLHICISQLQMVLSEYADILYKVLKHTAGEINYGSRVTDKGDQCCIMSVVDDFYTPEVLAPEFAGSESGIYRQISTDSDLDGYLQYIRSLPLNDSPEIFGLRNNADITSAQNESFALLGTIVQLQPKTLMVGGHSREELGEETARDILEKVPAPMNLQEVIPTPLLYEESMNTVLVQEVIRSNKLLEAVAQTLKDLLNAPKGLVVMSSQLELVASSLYNTTVPKVWNAKAYPSLKPLASWVSDLLQQIEFLKDWISHGLPSVFWIRFFFPQAFLTGALQNFARKPVISIDTISFSFKVMESVGELPSPPSEGCYIHGLSLEGARWDPVAFQLAEWHPKELYLEMAVICLLPVPHRMSPATGSYLCPIYKTLTHAGTLSATGHSTNYVIAVEIPTDRPQKHWIKRGTALICGLDF